ncbi:MAG: tRNA (adenosine(37)-N6)-threonylcarbamoyltransferase complex dimerization subunit type 1 TsaB [Lachnospiraceae bacterium]|nr:tRNA (adenosine(37)-N6)-threonylcarbamoyltransferase complex dimerization subunit type 1 TsaB [Lachnospiraceae bacterium]
MRILAIDSSGLVASVALLEDEDLIAEYTIHYKKTHSQTLLPMLEEIKKMTELDLHTIDAIAVAGGPGSFTGLRIGSATAKGLAQGLNKPIIEVPTLEGLAFQLYGTDALVCPLMDARRNQVYTGIYEFVCENGRYELTTVMQGTCCLLPEVVSKLNGLGRPVILNGDGVQAYRDALVKTLTVPYTFAPAHRRLQSAAAVGALAFRYAAQGKLVTAAEHKPEYFRLSQAERELQEARGREHAEAAGESLKEQSPAGNPDKREVYQDEA